MCDNVNMKWVEHDGVHENEGKCQTTETWEAFSVFFGNFYPIMVALVAHTVFFMASVTMLWPSVAFVEFFDESISPFGRAITLHESESFGHFYYIGAILGPLIAAAIVQMVGRKIVIVLFYSLIPVTFTVFLFAKDIEVFYICRVLQGIYLGGMVSVLPVLLAQLLPEENKHFLLSLATCFGSFGIMTSFCLGPLVSLFCVNLTVIILSIFFIGLFTMAVPESPYYLMRIKGKVEAAKVLRTFGISSAEEELLRIGNVVAEAKKSPLLQFFSSTENAKTFFLATAPLLIQMLSGASIVQAFTELYFKQANLNFAAETCALILVCYQFSTVFLTPTLLKKKLFTIRSLFILSLSGMLVANLLLTFYFMFCNNTTILRWLPLISLTISVTFYNCGMDPIPIIVLSQTYPKNIDSIGAGITTSIYLFVYALSSFLPMMFPHSSFMLGVMFLLSALFCMLGILFGKYCFADRTDNTNK